MSTPVLSLTYIHLWVRMKDSCVTEEERSTRTEQHDFSMGTKVYEKEKLGSDLNNSFPAVSFEVLAHELCREPPHLSQDLRPSVTPRRLASQPTWVNLFLARRRRPAGAACRTKEQTDTGRSDSTLQVSHQEKRSYRTCLIKLGLVLSCHLFFYCYLLFL